MMGKHALVCIGWLLAAASCGGSGSNSKDSGAAEICDNDIDDNGNGFADCLDFECAGAPGCERVENSDALCGDGRDNDGNGFIDCQDTACRNCDLNVSVATCPRCP